MIVELSISPLVYFMSCILSSVIRCIYIYDYVLLLNYEKPLFSSCKLFVMKSALSDIIIALSAFLLLLVPIQFISTYLNLYV